MRCERRDVSVERFTKTKDKSKKTKVKRSVECRDKLSVISNRLKKIPNTEYRLPIIDI